MKIRKIGWGNPENSEYDILLDHFSGTKIQSIKTSSVPLAQYWQNTEKRLEQISKILNENLQDVEIYFEYPTPSLGRAKASMTDVMIIAKNIKIAIEAKYTEYQKTKYQEIRKWLKEDKKKHREDVLKHWWEMIRPFVSSSLDIEEIFSLPYQFFHRTASACYNNKGNAYVLYQLFWDKDTKERLEKFKELINRSVEILQPKEKLKIIAQEIEVIKRPDPKKIHKSDVFQRMKSKEIYEFEG